MNMLSAGVRVKNRYIVQDVVGQGSMAGVYRVIDDVSGAVWALKEMSLEGMAANEAAETRDLFDREASILLQLAHPAFPLVMDAFAERDRLYLVMEMVEGRTLEAVVEQNGPCPEGYILPLAQELAAALAVLHTHPGSPIIYRDLKPSNVMVADDGTVKLVDFGIARVYKPGQAADTHVLGTPGFAPPEQWGSTQTTPRSDLYALGATLYFALTGTDPGLPGEGHPTLRDRAPACSIQMETLLERCLQQDPLQRPSSAAEVLRELESVPQPVRVVGAPLRQRASLLARWMSSSYRFRPLETGTPVLVGNFSWCGVIALILFVSVVAALIVPGFVRAPQQGQLTACKSNLKNLGTALEMYSADALKSRYKSQQTKRGEQQTGPNSIDTTSQFPPSLSGLTPDYLKVVPTCPSVGTDTYSKGYQRSASADAYTVFCSGGAHSKAATGPGYPQYTWTQGLISQ